MRDSGEICWDFLDARWFVPATRRTVKNDPFVESTTHYFHISRSSRITTKEVHKSSPQKSRIWYAPTKESVPGTGVFRSFVRTVLDVCRTQLQTFGLSVSNFSIAESHISFIGVSHYSDGRCMLIADWWVHLTFRAVSTSGTYHVCSVAIVCSACCCFGCCTRTASTFLPLLLQNI